VALNTSAAFEAGMDGPSAWWLLGLFHGHDIQGHRQHGRRSQFRVPLILQEAFVGQRWTAAGIS